MDPLLKKIYSIKKSEVPDYARHLMLGGGTRGGPLLVRGKGCWVEDIDGKKYIEEFKAGLAQVGFDPQRDVFSWWSGEMMSVTLPPVVVTPMSSSDSVLFIRVKDSKLASEKVASALGFISAMMQGAGQALTSAGRR